MGIPIFPPQLQTDLMKPYYAGLEKGELRITICAQCGHRYWYPPEVSPCHPEAGLKWWPVSNRGRVYAFTTVHRSLLPGDQKSATPYTVLLVEPEDAPGIRIAGLYLDAEQYEPHCDMQVKLVPVKSGKYFIPGFTKLEAEESD